jgi:hypothetical protein
MSDRKISNSDIQKVYFSSRLSVCGTLIYEKRTLAYYGSFNKHKIKIIKCIGLSDVEFATYLFEWRSTVILRS